MPIITPFETGVKSAGGGYHPKFKATGGLIVEPQPEAKTPAVKTSYFTTTGKLRNRKNFIYSQPEFENVRRKPGDPYPSSKPSFHGNLAGGGIDWKNPNIGQYRETANATENRMIVDGQQKTERFPIQWLKPEHINFSGMAEEALFRYKSNMSANYMRDKVEQLRQKGYSEDEINKAIAKLREKDIETEVKKPFMSPVSFAFGAETPSQVATSNRHGAETPSQGAGRISTPQSVADLLARAATTPVTSRRNLAISMMNSRSTGTPPVRVRSAGSEQRLGTAHNPVPVPPGHRVTNGGEIVEEMRGRPRVRAAAVPFETATRGGTPAARRGGR
jgi:hypothetical protein